MKRKGSGFIFLLMALAIAALMVPFQRKTAQMVVSRPSEVRAHTVVIDPGHGGCDGGAISCTGRAESEYNLEISLRLRDLLEFLGLRTLMIRESDISVHTEGESIAAKKISDLKTRVQRINAEPGAILISIHQNSFPDSRYHGLQVFYGAAGGGKELAQKIQSLYAAHLDPQNHRRIKKARGIYLMEHINCTGVLVECGFLTNPGEEAMLRAPDYQKKLCALLAAAAAQFLTNPV